MMKQKRTLDIGNHDRLAAILISVSRLCLVEAVPARNLQFDRELCLHSTYHPSSDSLQPVANRCSDDGGLSQHSNTVALVTGLSERLVAARYVSAKAVSKSCTSLLSSETSTLQQKLQHSSSSSSTGRHRLGVIPTLRVGSAARRLPVRPTGYLNFTR